MKSEKFSISGNSIFARFIRQNLDEIVKMKLSIHTIDGFLYITEFGEFKIGNNDQYGHSDIASFGGGSQNEYSAVKELQELIDAEPFDNDMYNQKMKHLLS